ncbi:YezD family protein [Paenibacillus sp. 1P07SE]|uniref:YezD family protein n=1 Tax=Paenibacillus sp. 1P07SE TaxID=3132209 RepID=UPI0039A5DAA1
MAKPLEIDEVWQERILGQVSGLEYGSVLITVHDGRIVQIERTERKRFDNPPASPPAPAAKTSAGNPQK